MKTRFRYYGKWTEESPYGGLPGEEYSRANVLPMKVGVLHDGCVRGSPFEGAEVRECGTKKMPAEEMLKD